MNKWLADLLISLFPRVCVLCDQPIQKSLDLCDSCFADLPWIRGCCAVCSVPLPLNQQTTCGQCLVHPPAFDRCVSAFEYRFPVDKMIIEFKFSQQLLAGKVLAHAATDAILKHILPGELPDVLIPVPLHPKRLRERGFNQALEIADVISQRLAIPIDFQHCQRLVHTPSQKLYSARQRRTNLRDVFKFQHSLKDQSVAIVDDVLTTGATADALTSCLKKAGASNIQVWTLARTPDPLMR